MLVNIKTLYNFSIHCFKKNSYVPKEGYKKVISFNIEGVIQTVLFNMNKTRKQFEYHCVEIVLQYMTLMYQQKIQNLFINY